MKISEIKVGDTIVADAGFTCMPPGARVVQADDKGELFVPCNDGRHYLDGQLDFNDHQTLVGFSAS